MPVLNKKQLKTIKEQFRKNNLEKHKKNIGLGVKGEKNGMFGKTHSVTARKIMSLSRIGKSLSLATKEKISKSLKGRPVWNKGIKWKRKINRKEVNIHV